VQSWAQDPSIGQRMINARAETLLEKPSFKQLVARRRCLVPADGFYEWRREGNRKVPMWIYLRNRVPFAFAGLWDCCGDLRQRDGEAVQPMILTAVLRPWPSELVEAHEVSTLVNSPENDTAECIQPVSYRRIPSQDQLF
jgi:putative SOS response-associated peptidase YedK